MKRNIYIALTFSTILLYACKKHELPPDNPETASPVFYLKGDVNGLPVKLEAGTNDYYMNSSYFLDTSDVYVYKAELRQNNCSSGACGYAVTILINDFQSAAQNAAMNVDGGIKNGTYIFNDHDLSPLYYSGKFTPVEASLPNASYNWVFSDGMTINGYEATRQFDIHKKYTATLNYAKDCSASHLNLFDIGNKLQTTVQVVRDMSLIETLTYQFSSSSTGTGPYKYTWDFGDSTEFSTESSPKHRYSKPGRYTAKLQVTDANNDVCNSNYQVSAAFQKDCAANYTAVFAPIKNTKAFSAITVLVTDAYGVVYSSKDLTQPDNSNFEIVSVENYKDNEQNEHTKKIKVKFSCIVKSDSGQIVIKNGEAVIAVSYK